MLSHLLCERVVLAIRQVLLDEAKPDWRLSVINHHTGCARYLDAPSPWRAAHAMTESAASTSMYVIDTSAVHRTRQSERSTYDDPDVSLIIVEIDRCKILGH